MIYQKGKFILVKKNAAGPKITSANDVVKICREQFEHDTIYLQEFFYCFYLNRQNKIIAVEEIAKGSVSGVMIDVKIILKMAIDYMASAIICIHNHPSGNLQFSDSDLKMTKKLKEGAQIIDCTLLDSIVIAPESGYISAQEENNL